MTRNLQQEIAETRFELAIAYEKFNNTELTADISDIDMNIHDINKLTEKLNNLYIKAKGITNTMLKV